MTILRHPWRGRLHACVLAGLLTAGAGCAHYHARPILPEKTAAELAARSLADDGLRRFLAESLGREPLPWSAA